MLLEINVSDELGEKFLNSVNDAAWKLSAYDTKLSYRDICDAVCRLTITSGLEALERHVLLK